MSDTFRYRVTQEFHRNLRLFLAKNADYGSSFEEVVELYRDNGVEPIYSVIPRLADKYGRIVNLTVRKGTPQVDESVIDTLRDLGTYCFMAVVALTEEPGVDDLDERLKPYMSPPDPRAPKGSGYTEADDEPIPYTVVEEVGL